MGRTGAAAVVLGLALFSVPLSANRESDSLRARGSIAIYSMDRDQALATYRQAVAADPQDAAAYRGVATALWLTITFRRGSMTVDDYVGRLRRGNAPPPAPPPAETATEFRDAVDKALELARKKVAANPRDPDAHYQLGAALGLRASYTATVEARTVGAFRAAREAYDEHERVLQLDAGRKDAAFIVGAYRYIVATLGTPARWIAYIAGFGGGKERGVAMVEEAAAYRGENQTDARLALVVIYNREKRYDEALKQLTLVREQYPRNRLIWLETGSTSLRAGRPADAERILSEGLARFAGDTRAKMFGEDALWYYKRGTARAALNRAGDADQDLRKAMTFEARPWVHGRTQLELGKLALKAGRGAEARGYLQKAATLCDSDNDGLTADEARRLAQ